MEILARVAIAIAIAITAIAAALTAGCYSPDVVDCKLACSTSADCVENQVCTAAKICASPSVSCDGEAPVDAGTPAGPTVPIGVAITGAGGVTIGPMMCATPGDGSGTTCTLDVPAGMPATAMAMPKGGDMFMAWTSLVCAQQATSCTFTPIGPTQLAVVFAKNK